MSKVSNYDTAANPITDGSFLYVAFKVSPTLFAPRKVAIETLLAQINAAHEDKPNPHPQYGSAATLAAHLVDENPHAITPPMIGAEEEGAAAAAIVAHTAELDPHSQYAKRPVGWFLINGNIALTNEHVGKSADITNSAVISLPSLATATPGYIVTLYPANPLFTITLSANGGETIKDNVTSIIKPAFLVRNRAGNAWIVVEIRGADWASFDSGKAVAFPPVSSGNLSLAMASGAVASGEKSLSMCFNAIASQIGSMAIGESANSAHAYAVVIGAYTQSWLGRQTRLGYVGNGGSYTDGFSLHYGRATSSNPAVVTTLPTNSAYWVRAIVSLKNMDTGATQMTELTFFVTTDATTATINGAVDEVTKETASLGLLTPVTASISSGTTLRLEAAHATDQLRLNCTWEINKHSF